MAIAYDAGSGVNSGSASSHTHSHTTGSGSNRFITIGITLGASRTINSVTYAGVTCVQLVAKTMTYHGGGNMEIWGVYAPAAGANNVVVTLSSATNAQLCVNTFTGVNQSNTIDATGTSHTTTSSSSVSVTTIADNCVLCGISKDDAGGATAGADTTIGGIPNAGSGDHSWYSTTARTPAGSHSLAYSAGGSGQWDSAAVSLAPPPTSRVPLLSLLGVG